MDAALRESLSRGGAVLSPASARPLHFGDAAAELLAALGACALVDRSNLARILAKGRDALDFLHRLSTADLKALRPGEGRSTVLTSPKGRIVERLFVHHLGAGGVLLVGGPDAATRVLAHLGRFTFREDLALSDETGGWSHVAVLGPRCREAIGAAGLPVPPPWGATAGSLAGATAHVLGEDGLSPVGLSVVMPAASAAAGWEALHDAVSGAGGRAIGDEAAEAWRVLRGLPASGLELTEEHNPLEAGLRESVSFSKGCYVGQEVVARLKTYDKVARSVVGFVLPAGAAPPATGTPVLLQDRPVGTITSSLVPPGRRAPVALAYLRRDVPEGSALRIGNLIASPVPLPFGETP